MNLLSAWNKFWFSPGYCFDLAFIRIIAVAVQLLVLLIQKFTDLQYVTELPDEFFEPNIITKAVFWLLNITGLNGQFDMFAVYFATLVFGFCALVGVFTNFTMLTFAVLNIVLQSFIYSFGDLHHDTAIMMIALLAISLGPSGKVLSIDSLWKNRTSVTAGDGSDVLLLQAQGTYAGWPLRLIQCFFPLMYLSAATGKLAVNDYSLDWANGFTLQYYFIKEGIRWDMPLTIWAAQFHYPLMFAQMVMLLYQATFFLVVPFKKLRWVYLPIGVSFHLSNWILMHAAFPQWIALLMVYIPWSPAFSRLGAAKVKMVSPQPDR